MPLSIAWGTLSTLVYASELEVFAFRIFASLLGFTAGTLAFISYLQTWRVGPGFATDFPELMATDPESQLETYSHGIPTCLEDSVEAKHDGGVRYCSKCQCFKPDRTHHCRQCGLCVLRMDHHCPWFSTCVGLRNHKFFVQFLVYVWLLCVCAGLVALPVLIDFFSHETYHERFIGINFVFFLMLSSVLNIVLLCFGGYTLYLAAANRTTLESLEPSAYRTSLPANKWRYRHPPTRESLGNMYDIGVKANLNQIMGNSWVDWLLPIGPRLSLSGTSFPVNGELRARAEERAQIEISLHQRKHQWQQNHDAPSYMHQL